MILYPRVDEYGFFLHWVCDGREGDVLELSQLNDIRSKDQPRDSRYSQTQTHIGTPGTHRPRHILVLQVLIDLDTYWDSRYSQTQAYIRYRNSKYSQTQTYTKTPGIHRPILYRDPRYSQTQTYEETQGIHRPRPRYK